LDRQPKTHQLLVFRSILGVVPAEDEHRDNVLGHGCPVDTAGNDTDAEFLVGGGDIGIGGGQEEGDPVVAPGVSLHLEEYCFASYSHKPSSDQKRHCLETLEAVTFCLKVCSHVAERVVESLRCSWWKQRRPPERPPPERRGSAY
jgi:hypothetical protein